MYRDGECMLHTGWLTYAAHFTVASVSVSVRHAASHRGAARSDGQVINKVGVGTHGITVASSCVGSDQVEQENMVTRDYYVRGTGLTTIYTKATEDTTVLL